MRLVGRKYKTKHFFWKKFSQADKGMKERERERERERPCTRVRN
jgi:hypothetical protein